MDTEVAVKPEPVWLVDDEEVMSSQHKEKQMENESIHRLSSKHVVAENEAVLSANVCDEGIRMLKSDMDIEEKCLLEDVSECNYSAEEMDTEISVKPEFIWLVEDEEMSRAQVMDEGIESAADCDEINKELKTEIDIEENCILRDSSEFIQRCKIAGDITVPENEGIFISSTDKLGAIEGYMLEFEEQVTVNVEAKRDFTVSTKKYSENVHNSFSKSSHTSEIQFKCDICGKCFRSYSKIVRHMNSHTLDKPFKCEVCNKCFTESGSLKMHMRLHTGEKPFKCKECSKCFNRSRDLKRHMMSHTGEKPFKCKECSKCFNQSADLKRHMMTHSGNKPFKCKECSKCFTQSGNFKQHMLTHTGEKPFKCKECSKCFNRSSHLKKHLSTHRR